MGKILDKKRLDVALAVLNNPELKCVPDEINGKTYSLCLMASADKDERVIIRHISPYMKPIMLCAFIAGYKQALLDNCFD
jgi:hypothetical protein